MDDYYSVCRLFTDVFVCSEFTKNKLNSLELKMKVASLRLAGLSSWATSNQSAHDFLTVSPEK